METPKLDDVCGYIFRSGFLAITLVQNSLLSLYADSDMENALKMFDEMCEKDVYLLECDN